MSDPEVVVSYGNAEVMTVDGKKTGKKILAPGLGKSGKIFTELAMTNFVSTLTVMARRDALVKAGGFNETPGLVEDWELWLRLSRVGTFVYVDKTLAYYRRHDATISNALDDGTNNYVLDVYRTILHQPLSSAERSVIHRSISGIYRHRATRPKGPMAIADGVRAVYHRAVAVLLAFSGR